MKKLKKLKTSKCDGWQGKGSLPLVLLEVQYENTRNVYRLRNVQ